MASEANLNVAAGEEWPSALIIDIIKFLRPLRIRVVPVSVPVPFSVPVRFGSKLDGSWLFFGSFRFLYI